MEEQIKRAVRDLNISYVFFWVLPAFLLGAGEFDLLPVGALVDNPQATYYMETAGILLTALCVPLALKLFSLVLKKKIDLLTIPLALKRYVQWSMVRLGLLEVAISFVPIGIRVFAVLSKSGCVRHSFHKSQAAQRASSGFRILSMEGS